MTDIEQSRVLEMSPGRTEESTDKLLESLEESQRKQVEVARWIYGLLLEKVL